MKLYVLKKIKNRSQMTFWFVFTTSKRVLATLEFILCDSVLVGEKPGSNPISVVMIC